MFRQISDFLSGWEYETDATLKLFHALTDASLSQRVTPDGRSLGFLAWHITTTLTELCGHAGLPVNVDRAKEPMPASAAAIAAVYEADAKAVAGAIQSSWTDAQLPDKIPMYGDMWTKGATLAALVAHQAHHRGQMTVLMRQAGLKVPGIYGPAKEEWSAFGMQAQA